MGWNLSSVMNLSRAAVNFVGQLENQFELNSDKRKNLLKWINSKVQNCIFSTQKVRTLKKSDFELHSNLMVQDRPHINAIKLSLPPMAIFDVFKQRSKTYLLWLEIYMVTD